LDGVKDVPVEMGEMKHGSMSTLLTAVPTGAEAVVEGLAVAPFLPVVVVMNKHITLRSLAKWQARIHLPKLPKLPAEVVRMWIDPQEADQGVQLSNTILQRSSSQAPLVEGGEGEDSLSCGSRTSLDVMCLVEDDAEPRDLP